MQKGQTMRIGIVVLGVVAALPLGAQQDSMPSATVPEGEVFAATEQVNEAYDTATVALDRGEYARAIELFSAIVNERGDRADAALYWVAYAQQRQGDAGGAMNTIGVLRREFSDSAWLDDADHLAAEIRGARGQLAYVPDAYEDEAEDIRLYALNALMHVDSERAVPLLERMIRSDEPLEIRQRALFVLLQAHGEQALGLITEVARDDSDPDMRMYALRHLGVFGGEATAALMDDIYASSTDAEVKEAIISGYMMNGSKARLYEIARNEPVQQLRVAAIRHLAMAGGVDELWELYESEGSVEARKAILESMFMTGDMSRLLQVAQTESDVQLRRAAIQGLGMSGDRGGAEGSVDIGAEMLRLYRADEDATVREAILNALWMRGEARPLIELYEGTDDDEQRRRIVQALSMLQDEAAIEFLIRILEQ